MRSRRRRGIGGSLAGRAGVVIIIFIPATGFVEHAASGDVEPRRINPAQAAADRVT